MPTEQSRKDQSKAAEKALFYTSRLICDCCSLYLYKSDGNISNRSGGIQYTAAGKTTYPAKSRISKSEDISIIEKDKELIALDKTPLYFTEDEALMLTSVYSIIQPNLALTNKVGINSIIYLDDDGRYYVDNTQATVRVADFFLFDGKDTFFLNPRK